MSGGPITLTHPEATRYFMTIKEAVSLVSKSTTIEGNGDIYVLKMGDPINIFSNKAILKNNNQHENNNNNNGIEIKTIGLRPGEKLHEQLFYEDAKKTNVNSILRENINHELEESDFKNLISTLMKLIPRI